MEPLLIGIETSGGRLPEAYDDLSKRLEGVGTVYIPHVVIPPEARMAIIRPPRVVVGLSTAAVVEQLESWAAAYVGADPSTEVRFHRGGRTVVMQGSDPPTVGRLSALVIQEEGEDMES